MVAGTTPRALLIALVGMSVMFAVTGFLASAYRAARHNRAESHFERAKRLEQAGRREDAIEEYRAALSFSTTDSRYRLALALELLDVGRLDEAEVHLGELRDADPTNAIINVALAHIAVRQHRYNDAVLYYHRAIYGLWPDQPEKNRVRTRFELVDLLTERQNKEQVVAELLGVAGEAPGDAQLQKQVADRLLSNGAAHEAADIYQAIVTQSPKHADAWRGLGQAQFVEGDYQAARAAFRKALHTNPDDDEARRRLDECDEILSLDPSLPRLNAVQRFDRGRQLIVKILSGLAQCTASSAAPPPAETAALANSAHALLSSKPRRKDDGDTQASLTLAQNLWKAWSGLCPAAARDAGPVAVVIGKVSR